ncbi:hypothetical protein FKM82_027322 [Ascaphus truei]
MESTPSSLGMLTGYDSSGSEDEGRRPLPSAMNFFADSASSSDEEGPDKKQMPGRNPAPSSSRLPAPLLGSHTGSGGVFSDPFREKQRAHLHVLEQHVKLSDSDWARGGRGVCLAYQRDGRCRYGTSCKYSHGSDLPQGEAVGAEKGGRQVTKEGRGGGTQRARRRGGSQVKEDEEEEKRKRKKPGLTNTLIPPKRSLKNYKEQLAKERPWAV